MNLDFSNWKPFKLSDVFCLYNGVGITKEEIECNPGDFVAVQSGEDNNGCIGKIDKAYCIDKGYKYTEEPCLTVARTGSAGFVAYQPFGCVVGDSAKILILKDKNAKSLLVYRQKEVKIRLLMKRKTLIESCKKSLDDYMECINKQVKKLNKNVFSNSIRISIEYRQVKDAVIAQLKTIKGVGDVSLTGFLQYSDFDIFTFADDIRKGKDILIEKYKFTGGIAEKIISHYDELSLLRMEEMQLDDIYHIELFVNGQFKPLERLSKGQQCTAILNILLVENKDPLIVDQPEDNLDNAFIADSLIASIRKNKLLRHYIFATHNANIPVFGDAELIVAMEEQDGKGRIIQGGIGSIDTPSVRDYAVQVLEGGREAFLMREKKYGIGEYNHFMNK